MLRIIIHSLFWFFGHLCGILHLPMWLYYQLQQPKRCPPIHAEIFYLSATTLAEKIRNQDITSEHVVGMYIERARIVNVVLNAIVEDRFELAMKEARHADEFVQSSGLTPNELKLKYPLLGVPLTVKESISVEGMSFSAGSRIITRRADRDADAVKMLKNAGAIVYLVSATPELCLSWECVNYVTGRTLNPYDTRRSSGGSSGGEAALISSCGSVIGIGSDLVGSGRGPPSFCGVYGFRTSGNLVPKYPHNPHIDSYALSICPITRFAIDLPLMLKCMTEPEKAAELRLFEQIDAKQIRVYYMFDSGSYFPTSRVNTQIVDAMKKVVNHLDNDNIFTKKADIKAMHDQFDVCFINLLGIEGLDDEFFYKDISIFAELVKSLICRPRIILGILLFPALLAVYKILRNDDVIERHKKLLREMKVEIEEMLGDDGVLLYPTGPSVAYVHGKSYAETHDTCYMGIFSVLDLPTLTIPIGQDRNGLPIGIQVIAKQFNERLPMQFARYMETSFGGWTPPRFSRTVPQLKHI